MSVDAVRFTDLLHLRFERLTDEPRTHTDKIGMKDVIRAAGGAVAPTLAVLGSPADLELEKLPPDLVIKPVMGWSARGVVVLRKSEDHPRAYIEMLKGWMVGPEYVRTMLRPSDAPHLVEERVIGENGVDRIPYDYKFYTFDGEIGLVLQIDRNVKPAAVCFYDGDLEPLAMEGRISSAWQSIRPGRHVRPRCAAAMIDMVRTVSRNLRTPFISVDMYAGRSGPVVGELTNTPGGPYYGRMFLLSPGFDEELGALWLAKARALGKDLPESIPRASPAREVHAQSAAIP